MLPRPPPPGLSATSAKIRAGRCDPPCLGKPRGVFERGQRRTEPLAPCPSRLGDLARQRLRRIGVGRGDHDGEAVERRVGVGEAAHHRDVQHAPGIGRLAHALLAEIDHLAVRPLVRVLAGQHADGGRHDRQADAREVGLRARQQPAQHLRRLRRRARACRDAGWCGSRYRRSPARHWRPRRWRAGRSWRPPARRGRRCGAPAPAACLRGRGPRVARPAPCSTQ